MSSYHFQMAKRQMAEDGVVRYETMRQLLGLPSGYSIQTYRLGVAWDKVGQALSAAWDNLLRTPR